MAGECDITQEDVLQLHEDVLESNEDSIRELLKEFREDGLPTTELCSQELEIEPLADDHRLNRIPLTAIHRAALLESSCILSLLAGSGAGIRLDQPLKSNGYSPLHVAASAGVASAVNFLSANGACVNAKDERGRTPMHHAALAGETDIAKILGVKGCGVEARDAAGKTPLHLASEAGHVRTALFLIKRGVDVNAADDDGLAPIHLAQFQGHTEVTEALLANGAQSGHPDKRGNTPLHIVAKHCRVSNGPIAQNGSTPNGNEAEAGPHQSSTPFCVLSRYGCDINAHNNAGETPLHLAVTHNNVYVVRELLAAGCSQQLRDESSRTALLYATDGEILKRLLDAGAAVNAEDCARSTLLHRLARNALVSPETVAIAVRRGADVNRVDAGGETPVFGACVSGSREKVEILVGGGADSTVVNSGGQTLLHRAIAHGHPALASFVADHLEVPINAKDSGDNAPLHLAVNHRQYGVVKSIVAKGGDVNTRGRDGILPATKAAFLKEKQILQFLLDSGALFEEVVDAFPLHDFASLGDLKSVAYLAENNVSVDRINHDRQSALHVAIEGGRWDVARYLLLERGASVTIVDSRGNTALHSLCTFCDALPLYEAVLLRNPDLNAANICSESPLHICVSQQRLDAVQLLVSNGADCTGRNFSGRTALHACAALCEGLDGKQRDRAQQVATFLAANGNQGQFEALDTGGRAVLHYLSAAGWDGALTTLLGLGADVNIRDASGRTPLLCACAEGHLQTASILVKRGGDVTAADCRQQSALHCAVHSGNEELVEYVLGCDADPNAPDTECLSPLHSAIGARRFEIAEILMMNDADVNSRDVGRRTPLHLASPLSPSHVVEALVMHGSDVNVADAAGRTALHASVKNPDTRVMKFLLTKGATADAADAEGNTALHLAAGQGSYEQTDLLLTAKARLDVTNKEGDSPLHLAAVSGESDVVELLVANEADTCVQNGAGVTPLMAAIRSGNEESAQVLLDQEAEHRDFQPDRADREGNTPALYAARLRPFSLPLLKSIQENGASLQLKNSKGESALAVIRTRKDVDLDRIFAALRIS